MIDSNQVVNTLIISVRGFRHQPANCLLYEFEDLISSIHPAELMIPKTEQVVSRKIYRTAKKLGLSNETAQKAARFRTTNQLGPHHKLIIVVADNVYQLHLLNQVRGWREHPATKVCYLSELWPGSLDDEFVLREPFEDFDQFFLATSSTVSTFKDKFDVKASFLPVGVDALEFAHCTKFGNRPIDIYYPGRQLTETHDKLLSLSEKRHLLYLFDTIKGTTVEDYRSHRRQYAKILGNSTFAIAYPAKTGVGDYTGNASEIGARYYEFSAAGAVVLGKTPNSDQFSTYLGWQDSVIDIEEGTIAETIELLSKHPEKLEEISRRNVVQSLRTNDWAFRWLEALKSLEIEPTPEALERKATLERRADEIEKVQC